MDDAAQTSRTFLLMCLFAIWIAAAGYSVAVLLRDIGTSEAASGLTPIQKFFGWQGVAGMFAFAIFGLGYSFPKESGSRSLSFVPLLATALLCAIVLAMNIFG